MTLSRVLRVLHFENVGTRSWRARFCQMLATRALVSDPMTDVPSDEHLARIERLGGAIHAWIPTTDVGSS
jgi:hypothetical protein